MTSQAQLLQCPRNGNATLRVSTAVSITLGIPLEICIRKPMNEPGSSAEETWDERARDDKIELPGAGINRLRYPAANRRAVRRRNYGHADDRTAGGLGKEHV